MVIGPNDAVSVNAEYDVAPVDVDGRLGVLGRAIVECESERAGEYGLNACQPKTEGFHGRCEVESRRTFGRAKPL